MLYLILTLSQLMIPGLLRYEAGIEAHEEVVLMTTKGEAIALGIAMMSTVEMSSCDHGVVAKVKRCIMERDLYPRRWGLGPTATEKKKLKASGKLDKFGRANEQTPAKWSAEYKDYTAPAESAAAPTADVTMSEAPAVKSTATVAADEATPNGEEAPAADDDKKKRKKHEGETPEEKAERKRRKAEKKAAKVSKRASLGKKDDSDSE